MGITKSARRSRLPAAGSDVDIMCLNVVRRLALTAILLAGCASEATRTSSATRPSVGSTGTSPGNRAEHISFTTSDGTVIDYILVVPPNRQVGKPGKVLLAFPPGGQDLDVTQKLVEQKWRPEALVRDWVVVSPAAPSTGLYFSDASARLVPELLDTIAAKFPPEGGRFDLAGVSNGGLSAFRAALSFPDRFRSLVVFPGYSPDGGNDPKLSKLRDIGVSLFVGGDDSGWLDESRATQQTLEQMHYTVELHVVPGEGHIIGSLTGAALFDAIARVRS